MNQDQTDCRIKVSVQRLREWQWLSTLSTKPDEVAVQLRHEARELIDVGMKCPQRAKVIGKLVFAYHKLILSLTS